MQEIPARDQGGEKGPVDGDGQGQEGAGEGWMMRLAAAKILAEKCHQMYRNVYVYNCIHGGFLKWGYLKMDENIGGYPYDSGNLHMFLDGFPGDSCPSSQDGEEVKSKKPQVSGMQRAAIGTGHGI